MRSLRSFIRESLALEAVGLKQFGRTIDFTLDVDEYGKSESAVASYALDGLKKATGNIGLFTGAGAGGLGFGRVAPAVVTGVQTAWRNPLVKLAVLATGFGSAYAGLKPGEETQKYGDAQGSNEKTSDKLLDSFTRDVVEAINKNKKEMIKNIRTSSIVSDVTATSSQMAREYEANYNDVAKRFVNSKKYAEFFGPQFPETGFVNTKAAIDDLIKPIVREAKNKVEAKGTLEVLAYKIMLVSFIDDDILLVAMEQDIATIESKIDEDDAISIKSELKEASSTAFDTMTSFDEYKQASAELKNPGASSQ